MRYPENIPLNRLVLDYLFHAGYVGTARAILKETNLGETISITSTGGQRSYSNGSSINSWSEPDGIQLMLSSIVRRKKITDRILCGRIAEAREMLNAYFPSVLNEDIEVDNPATLGQTSSKVASDSGTSLSTESESQLSTFEPHISSINPAHLSLNLRIHAFVESFRTEPLPYPPNSSVSTDTDTAMNVDTELGTSEEEKVKLENLLKEAHRLWNEVNSIKEEADRKMYQAEMMNVANLLAYNKPETSPAASYLHQNRRQAVADQIESAILYREGLSPSSRIEHLARQTQAVFRLLYEKETVLSPSAEGSNDVTQLLGFTGKKEEAEKLIQPFSLRCLFDTQRTQPANS